MARFTERTPTPRESRRAVVAVFEQQTLPATEDATGLDRVARILITDLRGSRRVEAIAIDWAGRVYERKTFPTVAEAKAAYAADLSQGEGERKKETTMATDDSQPAYAYVGNRNAASGRAEALLVRLLEDGTAEFAYTGFRVDDPHFPTKEEAIAWARTRWNCNR